MYKYQNVSGQIQTITTTGNIEPRIVEPNGFTTSDVAIENPNFKYSGEASQTAQEPSQTNTETEETK